MNDLRQAAQLALEALEQCGIDPYSSYTFEHAARTALRAALAQPAPEPVAWTLTETLNKRVTRTNCYLWFSNPQNSAWTALYTAPPQQPAPEPVGEVEQIEADDDGQEFAWIKLHHSVKLGDRFYTAPPQRKPLTQEEAVALWADKSDGPSNGEIVSYCRAIEQAHGIKE